MRIAKRIFLITTFIISATTTNKSQAMALLPEDQTSYLGTFIQYVYNFIEPAPAPKFTHYNEDLATLYKKTCNISELITEHLIDCAENNIVLSTHEVVDTVGFLMKEYSSQNVKRGTDLLHQLHLTGLALISKKALCIAAEKGRLEIVEILLDNSVSVDTQNTEGEPLLHLASKNGHHNVVDLLCRRGSEMLARNSTGCTALHALCMSDTLSQEIQSNVAKELAYNAPEILSTPNKAGQTPLDLVAEDRAELIRLLEGYGAVGAIQTKI